MSYTPRSRDRFKSLLAVLTGLVTFAAVTATGAGTGLAARQTGLRDQEREQEQARQATIARAQALRAARAQLTGRVVATARPQRTVVTTRVVHRVSQPGVASVGSGGTVSSPSYSSGSSSSTTTSGSSAAPAAAPAPAPAPAPSSGS